MPSPVPQTQKSHIEGVTISYVQRWPKWRAVATTKVSDQNGQPVRGAMVQLQWDGAYSAAASCTTKNNGQCAVQTAYLPRAGRSLSLTINGIRHQGFVYDPAANQVALPLVDLTPQGVTGTAGLTAVRSGGAVTLRWTLASPQGVALLRSNTGSRQTAARLSAVSIARQDQTAPAGYVYTDLTAAPDQAYTYWLVQIEDGELGDELGEAVVPAAPSVDRRLFVPHVSR
jgi:hypothetical protein